MPQTSKTSKRVCKSRWSSYRGTITTDEDKVEFAAFEKLHADYNRILPAVLDLHKRNQDAEAIKMFNEQLTPAWTAGRMKLNDIILRKQRGGRPGHGGHR